MSANKEGKKPQYKDYVTFVDAYKNCKKDESSCNSLTNSSNNSSTSINSDYLNEQPTKGFKEYLERYENQKFSSVKPTFLMKTPHSDNKKTVKTEIFININNNKTSVKNGIEAENLINTNSNNNNTVNQVTKIFEKNSNSERIAKTVGSKVNEYNLTQNETETDGSEQKKISVEEISKKFQTTAGNNGSTFETKRTTLKKQDSIKEKSKLFENNTNEANDKKQTGKIKIIKQNSFNENSQNFGVQNDQTSTKPRVSLPPKPPAIKIEAAQKIIATILVNGNGTCDRKNENNSIPDSLQSSVSPPCIISPTPCVSPLKNSPPPPPPIPDFSENSGSNNFPIPPPLPTNQNKGMQVRSTTLSSATKSPSLSSAPSPPSVKTTLTNGTINIPVPPPPPPIHFSAKISPTFSPTKANIASGLNNKTNITTGYSTLPRMNSNKHKDGTEGIPVPTLNKNDPRVKKLVYGALREMYGAYHDQANDYLATLPKNRVRKNNGLDSIINSIASQGGLDKLSGRANPKTETEVANH